MINLEKIRQSEINILVIGSYSPITQSILDFDYLSGRSRPSVKGIIKANKKGERFFYGHDEILVPYYRNLLETGGELNNQINFFLNVASARRVLQTTEITLNTLPNLIGGVVFAENTPELHALDLYKDSKEKDVFIAGPSSVGFLVPGKIKLGAIGGVEVKQLFNPVLYEAGNIAAFSASGGMTNELLNIFSGLGKRVSFCMSFGGDRFPITTPKEALLSAENDPETTHIVYFGELGGTDEYEIAEMVKNGEITKPVVSYVAGSIADIFPSSPQFGHAKAMAKNLKESAREKTKILKEAGVKATDTFSEFVEEINKIPVNKTGNFTFDKHLSLSRRKKAAFTSSIARETDSDVYLLEEDQLNLANNNSFAYLVASMLLGRKIKSKELEEFSDLVLKLLIDNGPSVSGAVNTIVAARAGKDLVSALCAGLLTVGKRFGGAVNQAAVNWIRGVAEKATASEFVESFAVESEIIQGIGHKKYRMDAPDPRVQAILSWSDKLQDKKYLSFALAVQKETSSKKANLILNVDGAMAAILLDILSEKEGLSERELRELTETEFFNAFFIIPRTVGFISHFLDQKRLDEGLYRLPKEEVSFVKDIKQS
jgi:ATP citrate (pro-S)-lyase